MCSNINAQKYLRSQGTISQQTSLPDAPFDNSATGRSEPWLLPELQKVFLFPEDKRKLAHIAEHLGAALLPGGGSLPEHAAVHFLVDFDFDFDLDFNSIRF